MLKGFRTVVTNIFMLLPILVDLVISSEFRQLIPVVYLPYYAVGVVLVNLILRSITTTPMGQK